MPDAEKGPVMTDDVIIRRTGDADSAEQILSTKTPGSMADMAPAWLLESAISYSKANFQQAERTSKAPFDAQDHVRRARDETAVRRAFESKRSSEMSVVWRMNECRV